MMNYERNDLFCYTLVDSAFHSENIYLIKYPQVSEVNKRLKNNIYMHD